MRGRCQISEMPHLQKKNDPKFWKQTLTETHFLQGNEKVILISEF